MTFYEKNRKRQLELASAYRARNRESINAKQRERYRTDENYRNYQLEYQKEYKTLY